MSIYVFNWLNDPTSTTDESPSLEVTTILLKNSGRNKNEIKVRRSEKENLWSEGGAEVVT